MDRSWGCAAPWLGVLWVAGIGIRVAQPQPLAPTIRPAIDRYCTGCHNSKLKTGGLALNSADDPSAHSDVWEKVVRKLRTRSMPPAGLPRPDEATYTGHPDRGREARSTPPRPLTPTRGAPIPSAASTAPSTELHPRPAGARRRRRTRCSRRRRESRLRQRDRRRAVADAARALRQRRAEDQPPRARQARKLARRRHRHAAAGPHPGAALRRLPARNPRRHDGLATRSRWTPSTN